MFRKLAESEDAWESSLDTALFAYRTSVHALTGLTPYRLVHSKEAQLPIDVQRRDFHHSEGSESTDNEDELNQGNLEEKVEKFSEILKDLHVTLWRISPKAEQSEEVFR